MRHPFRMLTAALWAILATAAHAQGPASRQAPLSDAPGLVRHVVDLDEGNAERLFASSDAAIYFPKLRQALWFEPSAGPHDHPFAARSQASSVSSLRDFSRDVDRLFPGYASSSFGDWILKTPASTRLVGAQPDSARAVPLSTPTPQIIAISDSFESGLGNWTLFNNRSGAYNWASTTCRARTGSRAADAVRGGSTGSTLSCNDVYPSSTVTQLLHSTCEGITGASQAWLDYYYQAALESGDDRVSVFYQEGTGDFYGYNFTGNSTSFFHLIFNLKQWFRLGDVTAQACPKLLIQFSSDGAGQPGFGAAIDDLTIGSDTPSFLRVTAGTSPASGPAPLTVTFTPTVAGASGSETYLWQFGDAANSSSTSKNTSFTYTATGEFSPRVIVTDANAGALAQAQAKVSVSAVTCSVACTATVSGPGTIGASLSFQATATPTSCPAGSPTFAWSFGDGQTSTAQNPSHSYATAGTYGWTLTASQGGASCAKSGSLVVTAAASGIPGDCDGSGNVSVGEVQTAINMLLGTAAVGCSVDANGNGIVSVDELQRVINAFLGVSAGIAVSISPSTASLAPAGTQPFTATVTGTSNLGVSWSVQQGAAGGAVTAQGLYTAPATAGTYQVIAASQADTSRTATATVTVSQQTSQNGIVLGTVSNSAGQPVAAVTVTAGGRTGQTNGQGFFTLDNVPANTRTLVNFEKPGYVPLTKVIQVVTGQGSFLDVNLGATKITGTISAANGGAVTVPGGGSITIGPNSLVSGNGTPYTGTANVALTPFDPTNPAELNAFPGKFEGVTKTGQTIFIVTFGFMDVTVTGTTGPLQLAAGKTATLQIPVPASILSAAPSTLPEWYFDPTDGKWKEEGTFTLAGNVYQGTIPHFSIWNCDVGAARCTITGRVVDLTGAPVTCARVSLLNLGPRGRFTSGEDCTPGTGIFSVPVDANSTVVVTAEKIGVKSAPVTTDTCVDGGTRSVGDIVLGTLPVKITLTWGQNPFDLDAHLGVPKAAGGGYEHVYFSRKGIKVENAVLDTDNQNGFGPEIFSISLLNPGTYRYSVHHYFGSGTISTSGASVNLLVEGRGIFNYTPPPGAVGTGDVWRVFDLIIDSNRAVTIRPINDYLNGRQANDATSFTP
ncbi:MAG: PKD domain-containing protein [Thermoanaerobaculia bacterium]